MDAKYWNYPPNFHTFQSNQRMKLSILYQKNYNIFWKGPQKKAPLISERQSRRCPGSLASNDIMQLSRQLNARSGWSPYLKRDTFFSWFAFYLCVDIYGKQ